MKTKLLLLIPILFMCMSIGNAQTLQVNTMGISPRDVAEDTLSTPKYFDRAFTGLQNVGNETKVFIKATKSTKFTSPVWTITSKPYGSVVTFGTTKDIDTSNQVITFIPDKVGTYKISVTDGSLTSTITFNSSLFVGTATGACNWCHNGFVSPDPIYSKWQNTGHGQTLRKGLDGTLSSNFKSTCVSCHSTGNDPLANNGGFDDYPFTFPSVMQAGMYDSLSLVYPKAMALSNVQCESCHGPGANHYSATDDKKIDKTLSYTLCASCHNSGTHNFFPDQYEASRHANPTTLERGSSTSCARCHSGSGFNAYVKGGKVNLTTAPAVAAIACAVCHDPHDGTNEHQLRTLTATLANGFAVTKGGNGILCMNCHQTRRDAVTYTNDYKKNLSHYGPHYGVQGDMINAQNAVTFGWTFNTSPHLTATENSCVDCHMSPTNSASKVGSHSLNMVDPVTGADNVAACAPCHGTIGTKFSDKKFYVNGNADLDKDGTVKGLQDEIEGMLQKLALLLPPLGSTTVTVDSTYTLVQAQAAYNYFFVEEDRSKGIHNPEYAYTVLAVSLQKLDPTTDIELIDNALPQTYSLEQNYPNPFNPTTTIKFAIPQQGNVKIEVYDIMGKLVNTLINKDMNSGSYTVTWDGKNNSGQQVVSGVYLYKIQSENFIAVKKMILLK